MALTIRSLAQSLGRTWLIVRVASERRDAYRAHFLFDDVHWLQYSVFFTALRSGGSSSDAQ